MEVTVIVTWKLPKHHVGDAQTFNISKNKLTKLNWTYNVSTKWGFTVDQSLCLKLT